jgi:hypothetical protein
VSKKELMLLSNRILGTVGNLIILSYYRHLLPPALRLSPPLGTYPALRVSSPNGHLSRIADEQTLKKVRPADGKWWLAIGRALCFPRLLPDLAHGLAGLCGQIYAL